MSLNTQHVTAHQHDTVDLVCWRHLGTTKGLVERVLELNPGLAELGPILPHGTRITLPKTAPASPSAPLIHLWT